MEAQGAKMISKINDIINRSSHKYFSSLVIINETEGTLSSRWQHRGYCVANMEVIVSVKDCKHPLVGIKIDGGGMNTPREERQSIDFLVQGECEKEAIRDFARILLLMTEN